MNEDVTGKNKQVSDTNFNKNNNDYLDYYQYSHAADMFRYRARLRSENEGESSNLPPVKHIKQRMKGKEETSKRDRKESIYRRRNVLVKQQVRIVTKKTENKRHSHYEQNHLLTSHPPSPMFHTQENVGWFHSLLHDR